MQNAEFPTSPAAMGLGTCLLDQFCTHHSAFFIGLVCSPMFHGTRPGWIEVISGVMFSGKSEELIRRVRRAVIARKKVQVFKSHLDARYAGLYSVASHDGREVDANPVDSSSEIFRLVRPETQLVAVDE